MVEMVVRDQHHVDPTCICCCKRRWNQPLRVQAQERVDERSRAAQTQRDTRLSEPHDADRPRWKLEACERIEDGRGRGDHVGLSWTFKAAPARSLTAANASACCSSGNEWLTSGSVSSICAAKRSVTHRHALRDAPKMPWTRRCPSTTVSASIPPAWPEMPSRTTVPPRRASSTALRAPSTVPVASKTKSKPGSAC